MQQQQQQVALKAKITVGEFFDNFDRKKNKNNILLLDLTIHCQRGDILVLMVANATQDTIGGVLVKLTESIAFGSNYLSLNCRLKFNSSSWAKDFNNNMALARE